MVILDHDHAKYIITQEFNKLTEDNFVAKLAQAKLATKDGIADFVKETDFYQKIKNLNKKVISNKTKHVLVEKKLTELTNKIAKISEKGYELL